MATKVVMEALSPTMEEGRLVKWLKGEGEAVKTGEPLAEVETDKAVMEIVARADGVLRRRLLAENAAAPVGTLLAVIAGADENIDALVGATPSPTGAAVSSRPSDVATPATPATPPAPTARATPLPSTVPPPASPPPASPTTPSDRTPGTGSGNGGRTRSSPLARRLATERGVDLGAVHGSGPGGRVIRRDIDAVGIGVAPPSPSAGGPGVLGSDYEDVSLTLIRKTIAKRLGESIGPIPTFYLTSELDLAKVAELRAAAAALGDDFKVSFNDVIMKAVATALAQHPEVNAHWLGDRIRYHHRVHLGMAVATEDGLIVPVIFDADRKRMSDISRESRQLAQRARERKLTPAEYTGSTFSVSNLGMFGVDQFTAIINPPEAGILAIGAVEDRAVVEGGTVAVRKRLRVTMSCDHRVIDGAVGARFLQTVRRLIENPLLLVF
ncbi:MAG: pyruvate dehydrogenase complex dihydrolipoamide acetyltransferase [Gemmatimonadaceae bacterium]